MPVTQVLLWLKPTTSAAVFENEFRLGETRHPYQVIRMWEQSPQLLLQDTALLPLAPLCASENSEHLLGQVAAEVAKIEPTDLRQEISSCTQLLAGLRFNNNLIRHLFRERIMRESVIFQDILEEGRQEEALSIIMRLLTRRFGTLPPQFQQRIQALSLVQQEDLAEALLDFSEISDLVAWLDSRLV